MSRILFILFLAPVILTGFLWHLFRLAFVAGEQMGKQFIDYLGF